MNEMIERVARAICAADHHAAWPGDGYNDRAQKRQYMAEARAAIAAMRTPTPAMVAEVDYENCPVCGYDAFPNYGIVDTYEEMIDAALKEDDQ